MSEMTGQSKFLTEQQASWVFTQILADYGLSAIRAKWESLKPSELKANLARRLGRFDWETISKAMERMPSAHPTFPPSIPELMALCESCKPLQPYQSLPAPLIPPEVIAARQADAEQMVRRIADGKPDRSWAETHRKDYLAGRALPFVTIEMASAALRENWHVRDGVRVCEPRIFEDAA